MCTMDHDSASGEGVDLRPETRYGQTNCWVRPDMKYVAVRLDNKEVWISTAIAAKNMSYQELMVSEGLVDTVMELVGQDIMVLVLSAPLAQQEDLHITHVDHQGGQGHRGGDICPLG